MPTEKLPATAKMAREMVRMQFALALVLVGVAVWLYHSGNPDAGGLVLGAIVSSWVNESIHRGKQASRSTDPGNDPAT